MATKKNKGTKKTTAKSVAKPEVPAVVLALRANAQDLAKIADVPEILVDAKAKLVASIDRYANRVGKAIASVGKKAEKEAAKVKRAEAKTKRDADRRAKKVAARDVLRKKLIAMDAELKS